MRAVFLDTVGLLATFDQRDQWHSDAVAVYDQLVADRVLLVTSEFVLLECANAASRMNYRRSVVDLRDSLAKSDCVLVADEKELLEAWTIYSQDRPGDPGVIDLISFALMRRYGINEAFTNDRHFKTAGFVTLF